MSRSSSVIPLLLAVPLAVAGCASDDTELVVFGAASMTDALRSAETQFEATQPGLDVILNLGGSSSLLIQMQNGGPADVFVPASQEVLDDAIGAGLVAGEGCCEIAANSLAIVVAAGNPQGVVGPGDFERPELLLGVCVDGVPCGSLARTLFRAAGIDPAIDTEEADARTLLGKVANGELDAGVVYRTDIGSDDRVESVEVPAEFQQTTIVSAQPTLGTTQPELAREFADFLAGPDGQAILADLGFGPVP